MYLCVFVHNTWILSYFLANVFEQMALGVQEKRRQDIMQYQMLLVDLEQWLVTVSATLRAETQPASPEAIRDQLLALGVSIPTIRHDLVMWVTNDFSVVLLSSTDAFNIPKSPVLSEHFQ